MINKLEHKIGYQYNDIKNLKIALTHSSYAHEYKKHYQTYERFEFLGDAILELVTSEYIFNKFGDLDEGELTKLRSALVCEKTLCKFSRQLKLGEYIKLSKGERHLRGSDRPSILADVFEAIVASIYIDGGIEKAKEFIMKFIIKEIDNIDNRTFVDYKTQLQEIIQKNPDEVAEYVLIKEEGPDHYKMFTVELRINNNVVSKGVGHSKKEAEQEAAQGALALMGY